MILLKDLAFFLFAIILCFIWLKIGRGFKIYEQIYEFSHAREVYKKKKNTITSGGIIIFLSILISLIFIELDKYILAILIGCFLFGFIGFIDDFIKRKRKYHRGLNKLQKMGFQLIALIFLLYFLNKFELIKTEIFIPLINMDVELGFFYYIFIILFMIFIVNSVNITDGLDGLLIGCFIIVLSALAAITYSLGMLNLFNFEVIILSICLGFLLFNFNPAKIFLGEIGSSVLGGVLAVLVIILKIEFLFLIIGFIFVVNGIASLITSFYYKILKRKIKLLLPHHFLQYYKIPEKQIVLIMWLFTAIFALLGLYIYF